MSGSTHNYGDVTAGIFQAGKGNVAHQHMPEVSSHHQVSKQILDLASDVVRDGRHLLAQIVDPECRVQVQTALNHVELAAEDPDPGRLRAALTTLAQVGASIGALTGVVELAQRTAELIKGL